MCFGEIAQNPQNTASTSWQGARNTELRFDSRTVIKIALLTQNGIQPTERPGAVEESIGRTICRAFPVRRQGSISAAVKQAGGSGRGLHCGSISSVWKSGGEWMGGQFCPICLPSNAFVSGERGTFNLKMLSISDCSLYREKAAAAMTTVPYEVGLDHRHWPREHQPVQKTIYDEVLRSVNISR